LCPESKFEDDEEDIIKVAVVGKPNVGKSSLINKILGEDRVIVSDVPGTTRDAIDTYYTIDDQKFCFIDTAGLRKRGKITDNIERYSTMRSLRAVDRSDVVLVLIDATEGVTEQDTKIAGYAHNQGKASIILVNKWDLIEKDSKTVEEYRNAVYNKLGFMLYAPIEFISAKTGQRVNKLVDMIQRVASTSETRIPTGMLNDVLNDAMLMVQPPSDKGRRLKIYYMTQVKVKPPTFVIFCNDQKLFHYSYLRYIENQMRTNFGFEGTPLVFIVRERNEDDK
jgi:GTP-binding protein